MTRFDDLKEAYEANRAKWQLYENDCLEFVRAFSKEFTAYLEADDKDVRIELVPEGFEGENQLKVGTSRLMWLDNDGFWHFVLKVIIERFQQEAANQLGLADTVNKWIYLTFYVKKIDGTYTVFAPYGPAAQQIVEVEKGNFKPLAEAAYEAAINFLENELEQFLNPEREPGLQQEEKRPIGFSIGIGSKEDG